MVRLVERDTELACDEAALLALPSAEHAAYGRTILNAADRLSK
jgi:beta-lactamase regulating signal transducer with metallopeptidase domain